MEKMSSIIISGRDVILAERDALTMTANRLDHSFEKAIKAIIECKGRVVVTGMGKSGHIGQKIAATFSSTGTPAFFLHPAEGVHGDLGMLVRGDLVLALSYSGETNEIISILPLIKRLSLPLVSITGNLDSTLGKLSDVVLDGSVDREACPMNLAPTTSTTVALAIGDALASVLVIEKGFKREDFALVHPSGSLGRQLLLKVEDVWHSGSNTPKVSLNTPINELLYTISSKGLGCAAVIDDEEKLLGIITDGDLRRGMEKYSFNELTVEKLMNVNPKTVMAGTLATEAIAIIEKHAITSLICIDDIKRPIGIVHIKDLLKAGLR